MLSGIANNIATQKWVGMWWKSRLSKVRQTLYGLCLLRVFPLVLTLTPTLQGQAAVYSISHESWQKSLVPFSVNPPGLSCPIAWGLEHCHRAPPPWVCRCNSSQGIGATRWNDNRTFKTRQFMHWTCSNPYWDKKVRSRKHPRLYIRGNKIVPRHAAVPETSFLVYQQFIHSSFFCLFQFCGIITWLTNDFISQKRGRLRYVDGLRFYLCYNERIFFKFFFPLSLNTTFLQHFLFLSGLPLMSSYHRLQKQMGRSLHLPILKGAVPCLEYCSWIKHRTTTTYLFFHIHMVLVRISEQNCQ